MKEVFLRICTTARIALHFPEQPFGSPDPWVWLRQISAKFLFELHSL